MKIYIGADHGGFDLKEKIIERLGTQDCEVVDMGAKEKTDGDDYVDYASIVGEELGFDPDSLGILICRNGVGVSIVANRFDGVRCALGFDVSQIEKARNDDDVNCLALPADYIDEDHVFKIVDAFLKTKFSGKENYVRRLEKLALLQTGGCCGGGCGGHGC
jgi:ribose 5-phosphate isomerase B